MCQQRPEVNILKMTALFGGELYYQKYYYRSFYSSFWNIFGCSVRDFSCKKTRKKAATMSLWQCGRDNGCSEYMESYYSCC